jgi:hypothetical protein
VNEGARLVIIETEEGWIVVKSIDGLRWVFKDLIKPN